MKAASGHPRARAAGHCRRAVVARARPPQRFSLRCALAWPLASLLAGLALWLPGAAAGAAAPPASAPAATAPTGAAPPASAPAGAARVATALAATAPAGAARVGAGASGSLSSGDAHAGNTAAGMGTPAPSLAGPAPALLPAQFGKVVAAAAGSSAAPSAASAGAGVSGGPRCSGTAATPGSLRLQLGKSTLMRLPETVVSRSVGNPAVAQAMLVAADTLYVVGVDIGSTNMIVQGKSGLCSVIEVAVGMDTAGLQAALAELLPDERGIRVTAAADAVVLSGTVADAVALASALDIAAAFVHRPAQTLSAHRDGAMAAPPAAGYAPSAAALAPVAMGVGGGGANSGAIGAGAGGRIINLLSVSAPQQVMLEVKIAEVSKTLIDQLEAGTSLHYAGGGWAATLLSNFLTGTLNSGLAVSKGSVNQLNLAATKQDGLVRMLAEPTVMAISGQEGSFLAGGSIFVPVAQDNNKVTLEEKEFGVGLRFTPTVLAGGRINLKVAPEVSDVSREGVGISVTGFNGVAVLPLITKRRAATTVQLYDGQSFAIGGLIKNNQTTNVNGLPLLGEVPVLGALFRSTDFQHDRTELLFVITVHLVKPLPPDYALPTDSLTPPTRAGLFLGGRLESPPATQPAPAPQHQSQEFELK